MSFAFTNTTAADQYAGTIDLGMNTNYAKVQDEPTMARVSNKTATMEQPELITYRCDPINKVSTAIAVRNPSKSQAGVQYTVKLETVDRATDAAGNVTDEPCVMWLTIKHPSSNTWTNAKLATLVKRLVSALVKDQTTTGTSAAISDADWRFEDLMRSALMPVED